MPPAPQFPNFDVSRGAQRFPRDRWYSALHWTLIGMIAAVVIAGRLLPQFLSIPRIAGFRMFIAVILCMNGLWWSVADRRFARHIRRDRHSRLLRGGIAFFSIALNAPILHMAVLGRFPDYLSTAPIWYAAAVTLWHIGLVVTMPVVAGVRVMWILLWTLAARLLDRSAKSQHSGVGTFEPDPSRRVFLKTSFGTAPMIILAGGVGAAQWQTGRFQINRHRLPAPWLTDRLKGLTITHLSDLHLGRLYRPERLPALIDAVNGLKSDILIITGDIVDNSNDFLPSALAAFAQMPHRHGVFACIGNHDLFDDRQEFVRTVGEKIPLLIDERRTLEIGGERLCIGGIDWARFDQAVGLGPGHHQHVLKLLGGYDSMRDGPLITLAHHPHAWDSLALSGVPLTLSGHTHGGQLMLNTPDMRPDLGIGNILFRYIRGFYQKPDSTLFVNRGIGNWFPVRINAPAEIVQIQLT